ncbi:MAG: hypothetical protein GY769_02320 [bacterium]|nr:hypothetical protein [bacterium]
MGIANRSLPVLVLLLSTSLPASADEPCESLIDVGRGPVALHIPDSHEAGELVPLVVMLHGYTATPDAVEHWLKLRPLADEFGFLLLQPQGTIDPEGYPFWNAGRVCCNWYGSQVDDVGYLERLVDEVESRCSVDPSKIYWLGHSNGAYMAYRMACERADIVTGLAGIAGVTAYDPAECDPFKPVHVLHIHGTADDFWAYDGGVWSGNGEPYPGALRTTELWARYNGCSLRAEESAARLDLEVRIPGTETTVTRYPESCRPGGSVELWSVEGADHTPQFVPGFSRRVIESLFAHPSRCRGRERIKRLACRKQGKQLNLSLSGGLPGDSFGVIAGGAESRRGVLDANGKARLRLRHAGAAGTAEVLWGCGSSASARFDCR